MGVVALAIRFDSPGPVIFRQARVGENGRVFEMLKFRSMVDGAEKLQDAVTMWTTRGISCTRMRGSPRDAGRTFHPAHQSGRTAAVLQRAQGRHEPYRATPGDAVVGRPYEPWQRKRFAVPQGLTGWWQVNGRSDKMMHLHTDEDLYYIQNYSLWLDLYILLKTPWVILRGKGAY